MPGAWSPGHSRASGAPDTTAYYSQLLHCHKLDFNGHIWLFIVGVAATFVIDTKLDLNVLL